MLNKRQLLLAAALGMTLVAAFFAPPKQDNELVEAKKVHSAKIIGSANATKPSPQQNTYKLIKKRVWATEKDKNLFPTKIKPLPPVVLAPALPPPKPTAPPLPFVYIGKVIEDGRLTVFVAKQEKNYLLKGGEVIEGVYRVDKVESGRLVFTYLPLETEQVMNIGGKD